MPLLTRLFIRAGILFFVGSMLVQLVNAFGWVLPGITPVFWHLLIVGWITQIIIGVAHWMFPGRVRNDAFKDNYPLWITFVFLNIGLILRAITEPSNYYSENIILDILIVISAILQLIAVLIFVAVMWPRARPKKHKLTKK